jgi:putative ABC transport system substrate-binding protein
MTFCLRRREFIAGLGGVAAAWPIAAKAQQRERMRRIGVLMVGAADDPGSPVIIGAFLQGMSELGWTDRRNVVIDYRWAAGEAERYRKFATELVELSPDVIVAAGVPSAAALQQATRSIPIVFVDAGDPVGSGLVASLARPGGNLTGFALFEYGFGAKWLELLKQIAPGVTRAAVFRDPSNPTGVGQFAVLQAVAPPLGVEVIPVTVREASEIERAVAAFARSANGGLIVTGGQASFHRKLIVALAARHRLAAVYPYRFWVTGGGLISYGPDLPGQFRQAAGYVDRILKGEKPADLPVQAPTKYELVINLKTAKALGLEIPDKLLALADEVIE